ncbi:unnamed protein product, partial [Symbiodinium sp. CCMP2456]
SWFKQALKLNFTPQGTTFQNLGRAAANGGDMPTALVWLQRAEKAGAALDKADFTALIECAAQKGDISAAELWCQRAEDAGVQPDVAILTALRKAAVNKNEASVERQDLPDDISIVGADSFQQLSDDFERRPLSGSEDSARFWLEKLKVVNLDGANQASCSEMLISASRTDDVEAAEFWLNKCRKLKLQPTPEAFHALIDLTTRKSSLVTAERVAQEARASGVELSRSSYSGLIVAACHEKNLAAAKRWLLEGLAANCAPSGAALQKAVCLAIEMNDVPAAEDFFRQATGKGTVPEAETFRAFVTAAAKAGDAK